MTVTKNKELEQNASRTSRSVYLVGGGIASLAAAAFLIRDASIPGQNITIIEETDRFGGSLDSAGTAKEGYSARGGRMLESKYLCTYDLFSSIPTLDGTKTVTEEITQWNELMQTCSHCRLVKSGQAINAPQFGLSEEHVATIERLMTEPEFILGTSSIESQFEEDFFSTNFWLLWCTTFAFQRWHSAVELKRYFVRFTHMVDGFSQLRGIMRTKYNQYDSMVLPLLKWLQARDVNFQLKCTVTDLALNRADGQDGIVEKIYSRHEGDRREIAVAADDLVIVTLGSMTEGSSLGNNESAALLKGKRDGGAWTLWESIARGRPEFGRPEVFDDHIDASKWISATTTLSTPAFFDYLRDFTGNVPGEGGLITLADSNWLISLVLPFQPHFIDQPEDVTVFWSYALLVDKPGNFVKKSMQDCSGREIFAEILGHLRLNDDQQKHILDSSITIPCMMPFITSQFLPRKHGDRPAIVPKGWSNLAFTGQYCEQPDDVVFTVEYSIRSAATAVYSLLGIEKQPPAIYKGYWDPLVLLKGLRALHSI